MEYYRSLIIKILERSLIGSDSKILVKLQKNIDLSQIERRELEEILDSII